MQENKEPVLPMGYIAVPDRHGAASKMIMDISKIVSIVESNSKEKSYCTIRTLDGLSQDTSLDLSQLTVAILVAQSDLLPSSHRI